MLVLDTYIYIVNITMILKLNKCYKINAKSNQFKYDTKRLNHCMLASKTYGHSNLQLPIVRLIMNFFSRFHIYMYIFILNPQTKSNTYIVYRMF